MASASGGGVELQQSAAAAQRRGLSFATVAKLELRAAEKLDAKVMQDPPASLNSRATTRSLIALSQSIHLVIVPLLLISFLVVVVLLIKGREVLVPFVIAIFFTYLLRPILNFLTTPYVQCYKTYNHRCKANKAIRFNNDDEDAADDEEEQIGLLSMHKSNATNTYPNIDNEPSFEHRLPRPLAVFLVMLLAMSILLSLRMVLLMVRMP